MYAVNGKIEPRGEEAINSNEPRENSATANVASFRTDKFQNFQRHVTPILPKENEREECSLGLEMNERKGNGTDCRVSVFFCMQPTSSIFLNFRFHAAAWVSIPRNGSTTVVPFLHGCRSEVVTLVKARMGDCRAETVSFRSGLSFDDPLLLVGVGLADSRGGETSARCTQAVGGVLVPLNSWRA